MNVVAAMDELIGTSHQSRIASPSMLSLTRNRFASATWQVPIDLKPDQRPLLAQHGPSNPKRGDLRFFDAMAVLTAVPPTAISAELLRLEVLQ
jgi:hypothetical protein